MPIDSNQLRALETIKLLLIRGPGTERGRDSNRLSNQTILAQKKVMDHLLMLGVESQWAAVDLRCAEFPKIFHQRLQRQDSRLEIQTKKPDVAQELLLHLESDDSAQLSQIETEKILAHLVETEMNKRLEKIHHSSVSRPTLKVARGLSIKVVAAVAEKNKLEISSCAEDRFVQVSLG